MKRVRCSLFWGLALLFATSLVAGSGRGDATVDTPEPTVFIDSRTFDEALRESLAAGAKKVEISFAAQPSANDLPERLDAWLVAVQQTGGRVDVEPTERTRGLPAMAFSLALRAVKRAKQRRLYRPAEDYDAVLLYAPGTGQVERVIFEGR